MKSYLFYFVILLVIVFKTKKDYRMNFKLTLLTLIYVGILTGCSDTSESEEITTTEVVVDQKSTEENNGTSDEMELLENKQKKIALENTLIEENLKNTHAVLLQELQKLKWDKEILVEKFELQKIKDEKESYEEEKRYAKKKRENEQVLEKLEHEASLSEMKVKQLEMKISLEKSAIEFKQSKLDAELAFLKAKKNREAYITTKPIYLDNPLSEDNKTLTISDRRIDLNGLISEDMATMIGRQINYFNNKDSKKPIFIVIDRSPGGEIMAGTIIMRSIESSEAPIYVVLKTFAASMAAVIVTLADNSYAYPHATILHHQPMSSFYGLKLTNLTEEKEEFESLEKVWKVFGKPVAEKMNITSEEFIKKMYEHSSKGNWQEYAIDAKKLKWVNHIVEHIVDKSVVVDPMHQDEDSVNENENYDDRPYMGVKKEEIGKDGKPFVYLPRLTPTDAYFIYNPDGYYRVR